jgi:hypothetical protein
MEEDQSEPQSEPDRDEIGELPEFDHADPLKREDEDEPPGVDPTPTLPPE